jgi:hypothetical protein
MKSIRTRTGSFSRKTLMPLYVAIGCRVFKGKVKSTRVH